MTHSISITFDNEEETFIINATAEVHYQPCEPREAFYPGCDATLEIESLTDDKTGEKILITDYLTLIIEEAFEEHLKSEWDHGE